MRGTGGSDRDAGRSGVILAVACDADLLERLAANVRPPDLTVRSVEVDALTEAEMRVLDDVILVLSPLVTPQFDAVELAQILARMCFRGRYLAIARQLPNSEIIRREVAASAPGIDFDVVPLDSSFQLHSV